MSHILQSLFLSPFKPANYVKSIGMLEIYTAAVKLCRRSAKGNNTKLLQAKLHKSCQKWHLRVSAMPTKKELKHLTALSWLADTHTLHRRTQQDLPPPSPSARLPSSPPPLLLLCWTDLHRLLSCQQPRAFIWVRPAWRGRGGGQGRRRPDEFVCS